MYPIYSANPSIEKYEQIKTLKAHLQFSPTYQVFATKVEQHFVGEMLPDLCSSPSHWRGDRQVLGTWSGRNQLQVGPFQLPGVLIPTTAQCAVCAVRWPCGILARAVKTLSHGKTIFLGYFPYVLLGRKLENLFRFSFSGTRNIIFGTLKIGQNDPEIPNLEFPWKSSFPSNRTSWDKYMLNDISRHKS